MQNQPDISQKKTQIVGTIGPASESPEILAELMNVGLNIARFNTKHNEPTWHRNTIIKVREVAKQQGKNIPILLDLQGPEVRTKLPDDKSFTLKKGESATFGIATAVTGDRFVIVPPEVVSGLQVGGQILLEDGACELVVTEKQTDTFTAQALYDCEIKSRKTVNTPGTVLEMPSLLPTDIAYLDACKEIDVEYVGLSFVRDKRDIAILRDELNKRGMTSKIIAKIENQAALDNLSELIVVSDAVMVARGDLGVEVPFYEVPHWQKIIIKECNKANKFVITATQMLLSMVSKPRPTRAEVSDVANAVYDGTDAVMLSEECAMGQYPVKTVETQAKIVAYHEKFV